MTSRSVGRIVWKEMRIQRGFLAAVIGLGLVTQMIPLSLHALGRELPTTGFGFTGFLTAFVMACCFAVGSTGITFAGESESRTRPFLQQIPIRWRDLLLGEMFLA